MVYILIILTGVAGGNMITTQEFNNQQACEKVAQELTQEGTWFTNPIQARCFPKGEE